MIDVVQAPLQATNQVQQAVDDAWLTCRHALKTVAQFVHEYQQKPASTDEALRGKLDEISAMTREIQALLLAAANDGTNVSAAKRFEPLQPTASVSEEESWTATSSPALRPSQPSIWSGFYNKTLRERFDVLSLMYPRLERIRTAESSQLNPENQPSIDGAHPVAKLGELPVRTANLMIENCIGVLGIPLGLGLNFLIDGKHLSVPMAVEEPSVVAAASSAAKLVASMGGGFLTATSGNIMTSQVQLVDTPDIPQAIEAIAANRERLLHIANTTLCPNMKQRGGGAIDIYCRVVTQRARAAATNSTSGWYTPCEDELVIHASAEDTEYLVVHIDVDVCEAMGANIVNTVAEGLSNEIAQLTKSRCGLRILTNLCMQRRARASFEIPVAKLGWKGVDGEQVAARIVEAYNFAAIDPYRAVTNNKGIMNGVDAVALATGQDWRAIEAAAHCYASRSGQYTSLSKYEIATTSAGTRVLRGSLELPIAVGSKGGALQTHPGYAATHSILHQPTARSLSSILLSVGLAQNFAAIRAIAITGIQKGHMALHARNIAVAAGAPSELVSEVCTYMLGRKCINVETAKEYLRAQELFAEIHSNSPPLSPEPVTLPSMFYVEIPVPQLEGSISLNIAFEAINKHPQYISIMADKDKEISSVQRQLLGDKGYNQLEKMFMFLASMRSIVISEAANNRSSGEPETTISRANLALQNKLQLLSILINILLYRLMEVRATAVGSFLRNVFNNNSGLGDLDARRCRSLLANVPPTDDVLSTGLPLLLSLCQVLHYHLEQDVPHAVIREKIAGEQWELLHAVVNSFELVQQRRSHEELSSVECDELVAQFMTIHAKRWQATMLLLIDSLALAAEVVTPARLAVLRRIGEYMEWEGTVAHDLARFTRALTESEPNVFVHWMRLRGLDPSRGKEFMEDFEHVASVFAGRKWQQITQERESLTGSVFSLPAVERVTQIVRDIYADRSGRLPRKESF
ncbi:hypothetical protein Poli38472_003382 [Pythium oligandrum]|uniref:Hydroxymethylglutaryl-CoA reductase (NADPH) n=1 Tax=Pythium oligandrum TaxID=41045 RepID=A0A8K1C6I6_PYTOL|nr:hypothetical protein Poli38472_003382 [Pythium oligandrum]|eukprot:TMW57457.1 hypothetical protein Poli38472_003382 [Pythium oligandrum]